MKAVGIVRNIDALGRLVIPAELRKENGWIVGTPVEMLATKEGIFLREYGADQKKKVVIENLHDLLDLAKDKHIEKLIEGVLEYVKEQ